MTLALLVLFALSGNARGVSVANPEGTVQSTAQQASAGTTGQDQGSNPGQTQNAPPRSNAVPSVSPSPQAPSTQPKRPTRRRRHKKKISAPSCDAGTAAAASSPQTGETQTTGATTSTAQTAPTNCPPSKIIVRHGGTSEPSIQLAGDQTPKEREATNQMLTATDANLKKLEGRQLTANQQDMVGHVRQFMQQSRTAMDGGDFARSRTLAWKAQLLSEELVKPPK